VTPLGWIGFVISIDEYVGVKKTTSAHGSRRG
jgi:hypothetical protein